MPFTLGVLIESAVLFVNAIAILNEERFLKPIGWGHKDAFNQNNTKDKLVDFIRSVRMLMTSKKTKKTKKQLQRRRHVAKTHVNDSTSPSPFSTNSSIDCNQCLHNIV
jgi:hypothetical protein